MPEEPNKDELPPKIQALRKRKRKPTNLTPDEKRAALQLLAVRQKLDITQSTMSTLLGCARETIIHWESGQVRIPHTKIMELALRYIMNTYAVKKPLDSLIDHIKEETQNEVPALPIKYDSRRITPRAKRKGSDPAE